MAGNTFKDEFHPKITVFFDGLCYLCSAEIEHYREKDRLGKFCFIDISSPEFHAEDFSLNAAEVKKVLHLISAEGVLYTGLESFIQIWKNFPEYRWLASLAAIPPLKVLLRLAYSIFALVRPWLPRKKCANNSCGWEKI